MSRIPTDLREPRDPRITVTRASRTHAYLAVDGKGIATVADLDYFEAILAAVEEKMSACAKTGASVNTQVISTQDNKE